ncbi:MAG: hypothetical protein PHP35_02030, partial [Candidatus Colwellbacteria bacterium]|nr:hypothetical protein [Candidatus Colwellbacteria bacterium]
MPQVSFGKETINRLNGKLPVIIGVILIAVIGAAFLFLGGKPKGAVINIDVPQRAGLGDSFDAIVTFKNESQSEMRDVAISLSLPKGMVFSDRQEESRSSRDVGIVNAGEEAREVFKLTVSDGAEARKNIKAEAEYIPGGVSKHISISKDESIEIEKPVTASLEFPDRAISGEEFDWVLTLTNASQNDIKVKADIESTKEMTTDFKSFEVTVSKGEEVKKKYKGSVILPEGEKFNIKASISGEIAGVKYLFDESSKEGTVAPSPLFIKAEIEGKSGDFVASPGESLKYLVTVRNNSDVPLQNVVIRGVLKGDMYNGDSISIERGSADKSAKIVLWDNSTDGFLSEIQPNDSRTYDFTISLKDDYSINKLSDRNFSVDLALRAESPTVPYFVKSLKTVNIASFKTKVAGRLTVDARGYFRDAASGIINDGDIPIASGSTTEATIHWIVSSYSTDMENVEIRAELPAVVELTG